jgi:hypothetical protein
MRVTRVWRASVLAVTVLFASQLAPLTAAQAVPPLPYAEITAPTSGPVSGIVPVAVDGHTDGVGTPTDVITTLTLMVDGSASGTPIDCTPNVDQYNCSGTISWDASGAGVGPHLLVVEMASVATGLTDSTPAVMVTVPAAPSATLTLSPPGDRTGNLDFTAMGTIDTGSTDTPTSLQLLVDGDPVGAPFACTANPCTAPFTFDTTLHDNTTYRFKAVFVTAAVPAGVMSTAITLTTDNPPPSVSILSPSNNADEQGTVIVSARGTVTVGETDTPTKIELFVGNGTTAVDSQSCSAGNVCNATGPTALTWDATGKSGTFTLHVVFTTADSSDTASVTVHVTSPAPTAAITSPSAGATVAGVVQVGASGTVDASQTDTASAMQLFVDGAASGDPVACPATKSCAVSLPWDASGLLGTHKLHVKFTTATGAFVVTNDISVNVTSAPPSSVVSSPASGSTVSGVVTVVTTGGVSPTQTDSPVSMQLLIDGTAFSAASPCTASPAVPHGCSVPYTWDTTGLFGAHTLQAKFVTHKGVIVLSAVSTVTVSSPAPAVVITSPADSSTVHRDVTITVTGAVDATQTDAPASMKLTLDGKALDAAKPCASAPTAPRTCAASFAWSTLGLTGKHILVATLTTAKGAVGLSKPTAAYVYGGTTVSLPKLKTLRAGRKITITGRVTALINHSAVPGVRVKILIVPSNGKSHSLYVRTDVHGYYKVAYTPAMNTTVEATVAPPAYYGTSHTFTKLAVIPKPTCTVVSKIARNTLDRGICKLPGMPKGTKLKLQYYLKGHWYTLGTGRAPGTVVPFSFAFANPATYLVRLVFAASHVFVATTGPSLKVVVK